MQAIGGRRARSRYALILGLIGWIGLTLHWHSGRLSWSLPEARADNITYAYDASGRLIQATDGTSGQAVMYGYDPSGNITSRQVVALGTLAVSGSSADQGAPGTEITIYGTGFSSTPSNDTVTIGGVNATVVSATQTQLVVTLPAGSVTGPISVTVGSSTANSSASFTTSSASAVPTITGFSPAIGAAGTAVTVSGTGFQASAANDTVLLNETWAMVSGPTTTSLTVAVPLEAGSGKIRVATPFGHAVSSTDFIVPPTGYGATAIGWTGRTSVGSSATVSLPTAGKVGLLLFDGTRGLPLAIGSSADNIASCTIKVFAPDGKLLSTSAAITGNGQGVQIPTLPTDGTYTAVVDPGSNTGSIALTIVGPVQGTLTQNGASLPVTLGVPGQSALLTFPGTQGSYVSLNLTNVTLTSGTVSIFTPAGAVLMSAQLGPSGVALLPELPSTGNYVVLIEPSGAIAGSLSVALDTAAAGSLTVGSITNVQLSSTVPTAWTFRATQGQILSIGLGVPNTASSPTISGIAATVTNPDGSTLTSGTFASANCIAANMPCAGFAGSTVLNIGPVGQSGTYTISAHETGSAGVGTLQVSLAAPVADALTANTTSNTTVSLPGQGLSLTFGGTSGEYISAGISVPNTVSAVTVTGVQVTVLRPDGTTLESGSFTPSNCTAGFPSTPCGGVAGSTVANLGPLPADGTYTILIQQTGADATGSFSTTVATAVTGTLTLNNSANVSVSLPGQGILESFSGSSGQYLSLGIAVQNAVLNPTIAGLEIVAYGPDGSVLASQAFPATNCEAGTPSSPCAGYAGSGVVNLGPLIATGTYKVRVEQTGAAATGTVVVALATPVSGTLATNSSANLAVSLPGQGVIETFSGTTGENVTVGVTVPNSTSDPTITGVSVVVLNPSGTMLASQAFTPVNCTAGSPPSPCAGAAGSTVVSPGPLPANGTYVILVEQTGAAATGTFAISLPTVITGTLTVGNSSSVTIGTAGQGILESFSGTASQYLSIGVSERCSGVPPGTLTILQPNGSTLASGSFSPAYGSTFCAFGQSGYTGGATVNIGPLPATGTYTALFEQTGGAGTGTLALSLSAPVTGTLTVGSNSSVSIGVAGQEIEETFSGTVGQNLAIGLSEQCSGVAAGTIMVLQPNGSVLGSDAFTATYGTTWCGVGQTGYTGSTTFDIGPLPATGTYTALIQQTVGAGTGTLSVSLSTQ